MEKFKMNDEDMPNCWEIKKCGYHPDKPLHPAAKDCSVVTAKWAHGINRGIFGGRACWAFSGTRCMEGKKQNFEQKIDQCARCEFFQLVKKQEGAKFKNTDLILLIEITAKYYSNLYKEPMDIL